MGKTIVKVLVMNIIKRIELIENIWTYYLPNPKV